MIDVIGLITFFAIMFVFIDACAWERRKRRFIADKGELAWRKSRERAICQYPGVSLFLIVKEIYVSKN